MKSFNCIRDLERVQLFVNDLTETRKRDQFACFLPTLVLILLVYLNSVHFGVRTTEKIPAGILKIRYKSIVADVKDCFLQKWWKWVKFDCIFSMKPQKKRKWIYCVQTAKRHVCQDETELKLCSLRHDLCLQKCHWLSG